MSSLSFYLERAVELRKVPSIQYSHSVRRPWLLALSQMSDIDCFPQGNPLVAIEHLEWPFLMDLRRSSRHFADCLRRRDKNTGTAGKVLQTYTIQSCTCILTPLCSLIIEQVFERPMCASAVFYCKTKESWTFRSLCETSALVKENSPHYPLFFYSFQIYC